MARHLLFPSLMLVLVLARFSTAEELPAPALEAVAAFEKDTSAIVAEAEKKLEKRKAELVEKLKKLQDEYTKAGKLDEAVAIRDAVRGLTTNFAAGTKVEVEWRGSWYPAQVLEAKDGKWYIHYDNDGDEWNEWVDAPRIRCRGGTPAKPAGPAFPAGSKVDVKWEETWWPAEVIEAKDGTWHIHYDGYGDEWNEWVETARIRTREAIETDAPRLP